MVSSHVSKTRWWWGGFPRQKHRHIPLIDRGYPAAQVGLKAEFGIGITDAMSTSKIELLNGASWLIRGTSPLHFPTGDHDLVGVTSELAQPVPR